MTKVAVRIVDEQKIINDIQYVENMIDELSAAALNLGKGVQSYNNFIQTRDQFKTYVETLRLGYKIVEV